jgi:hypothetical protein
MTELVAATTIQEGLVLGNATGGGLLAATAALCSDEESSLQLTPTKSAASGKKRSISVGDDNLACNNQAMDVVDDATSYDKLSKDDLVAALKERDARIAALEKESNKRAKTAMAATNTPTANPTAAVNKLSPSSSSSSSASADPLGSAFAPTAAATAISPEKVRAKVEQVRRLAFQGIKSQIKWRPSCKNGTARFAFALPCDEVTFRSLLNLKDKDKTKGGKFASRLFEEEILRNHFLVRIQFGYLSLSGDVNVTYNKGSGEVKITGAYGV